VQPAHEIRLSSPDVLLQAMGIDPGLVNGSHEIQIAAPFPIQRALGEAHFAGKKGDLSQGTEGSGPTGHGNCGLDRSPLNARNPGSQGDVESCSGDLFMGGWDQKMPLVRKQESGERLGKGGSKLSPELPAKGVV
jgi:hypothetical protein